MKEHRFNDLRRAGAKGHIRPTTPPKAIKETETMSNILPQQQLLLELLVMSGKTAIATSDRNTILWRTLGECEDVGWLTMEKGIAGYEAAEITDAGRAVLKGAM